MPSFEEQVQASLAGIGNNQEAARSAQAGQQAQYSRKVAHLRQLATDAAAHLRNNSVRPIPLLRYHNELRSDTAANYRSAFLGTRAWYMGRLSLTEEGAFVSGHAPSQSSGQNAEAELLRLGINPGDWYIPHENPLEVPDIGPARYPLADRWGSDEFEVLVHSREDYMTVGQLVTSCTAELVNGGPDFTAATFMRLESYQ